MENEENKIDVTIFVDMDSIEVFSIYQDDFNEETNEFDIDTVIVSGVYFQQTEEELGESNECAIYMNRDMYHVMIDAILDEKCDCYREGTLVFNYNFEFPKEDCFFTNSEGEEMKSFFVDDFVLEMDKDEEEYCDFEDCNDEDCDCKKE